MHEHDRKIAAILAADVVDYSRLMGLDEEATLAALKLRRAIFDRLVAEFGGHEFGSVGDSLMAEFPSAVNAVTCAVKIQEQIDSENATLPVARRMQLRIGVNLGDVIEENGTAFGEAVNIAARLQSLAKPGGVLISGAVHDQVVHKLPVRLIGAGTRQVKNIAEPVRTFEVLPAESPGIAGRVSGFLTRATSRRVRRAALAILALMAAVSLGMWWQGFSLRDAAQRLAGALGSHGAQSAAQTIAVLPFVNMSGDPHNDYLGDGLAEELSNRLTKIPQLRVAARSSAFAMKGRDLEVNDIAARLGVRYVVEGSVKRQADRIRVTAALVEGPSRSNRWSNAYEPATADLFKVEDDIAEQVVKALELVLVPREQPAPANPGGTSALAYDFYLQGLAYLRQPRTEKSLAAAEQLFQRALAEQPTFARAQAGMCETRVELYVLEKVPSHVTAAEEACANAEALDNSAQEVHMAVGRLHLATGDAQAGEASFRRALALVPQSPDAQIGLADALAQEGKMEEADRAYQRAIAMQSHYAASHMAYGNFLFYRGRAAEASAAYERVTKLTPDNPDALSSLGGAYLLMGNFEQAGDAFERAFALEPRRGSYNNIGVVHYYLGRYDEAAQMYRKAVESAPSDHRVWGNLADALLFGSHPQEAREAYRRALELADGELAVNPRHALNQAQAAYYAMRLGEIERARQAIAIALAEGASTTYVEYYVALAEEGLGNRSAALAHARRALKLGYPEKLMRAAPELGEVRKML
jgi:adenylate cyclase